MTDYIYVMSYDMYTYGCNFIPFCCVIEALENDQITLIDACSIKLDAAIQYMVNSQEEQQLLDQDE